MRKGITTYLLHEDDYADLKHGANPKHLGAYFFVEDNRRGEIFLDFVFIAPPERHLLHRVGQ